MKMDKDFTWPIHVIVNHVQSKVNLVHQPYRIQSEFSMGEGLLFPYDN